MRIKQPARIRLVGALAAVAALLLVSSVALASHQWSNYHWPSDNPTLEYDDATTGTFEIPGHVGDWNNALSTGVSGPTDVSLEDALGGAFDVEITEGRLRGIWLGVASILVETATGHILEGKVTLNTPKFSLSADEWAHVACQEIGHILGLDHNRGALDTCMNDRATLGSALTPNQHDADELAAMYGHADAPTTPPEPDPEPDPGPGPGDFCDNHPDHKKCNPEAKWVTVHTFPAP